MKVPFIVNFMYIAVPILTFIAAWIMMRIIPRVGDE